MPWCKNRARSTGRGREDEWRLRLVGECRHGGGCGEGRLEKDQCGTGRYIPGVGTLRSGSCGRMSPGFSCIVACVWAARQPGMQPECLLKRGHRYGRKRLSRARRLYVALSEVGSKLNKPYHRDR
jgi:hypothetical protein